MKTFISKTIALISGLFLITVYAAGQTQPSGEFGVSLGAGNSSLKYQIEQGSVKSGFGANFGVSYTAFFSQSIGLSFGLECSKYGSTAELDNDITFQNKIATPSGLKDDFFLNAEYKGLKEKQSALMLQIPVMLQFQMPMEESSFFYFSGGLKIGFPVSSKWKQDATQLAITGYSEYTAQTYENMPTHNFSTQKNFGTSGKLEFGTPVSAVFETGLKFKTSYKNSVYAGLYLDLGLNSIYKEAKKSLYDYNNFSYNSILQTSEFSPEKIKSFAFGLKIRMAFGT
jgi:hypothetical protein